ncbi:MAG: Clp protease [Hyphomicrobium sp.]|nr:Clp protease [Hyphomicrobium sp.]
MIVDDLGRIPMSPYLTATLTRAADYATAQAHREVTLEHLLLALAEDPEATVVLKSSNIDLARLTAEVSDFLGHSDDRVDPASGQTVAISADLRRILEAAAAAARQGRRREINGAIVLAAIVGDGKSTAAHLLRMQGLTFEEAIRALQRATPAQPQPPAPQPAPAPVPQPPQHRPEPQPVPDLGPPPPPDLTRPASTEEILTSARERLQQGRQEPPPAAPATLPRANYPDLGGPPQRPAPPPAPAPAEPAFERDHPISDERFAPQADATPGSFPPFGDEYPGALSGGHPEPQPPAWPSPALADQHVPTPPAPPSEAAASTRWGAPPRAAPPQTERRRAASSGPFVGSWPLIEAGQLVENIPRRMRIGVPVVAEARIARADVKALAEGLAGGGAAFRHEVVVTKAMSVRLRAPDGGFTIENRSPETQWIENVLGLGADDYASWRWTVTPRSRGRRQLQLIVSARTVGADGMTAETALPDQIVDVKVSINIARTAARWIGWIAAAIIGGLLAKFGETVWVILKLMIARQFGS